MGKEKKEKKEKKTIEVINWEKGDEIIFEHPIFGMLSSDYEKITDKHAGTGWYASVKSDGTILCNLNVLLEPKEWAYVIARCMLHLAFGHFDAEKIGNCSNPALWNMACDMYIEKFLGNLKFGTCPNPYKVEGFSVGNKDEAEIYQYLVKNPGTYKAKGLNMIGLDKPMHYEKGHKNQFIEEFAYALTSSVTEVLGDKCLTSAQKAAQWFINRYPLLGGIAAGFDVVESHDVCMAENIQVAAVAPEEGKIFVNPRCRLSWEELKFVLAHEFLHAGLGHHTRRMGRDPFLWNVACDYVINSWLVEMGIGRAPKLGLLFDEELSGMSAEEIYDRIIKDLKKYSDSATFRGGGMGDILKGKPGIFRRPEDGMNLDDFYKNALMQGLEYHQACGRGFVSAGLIQEIKALSMPAISWDVELAQWFELNFPNQEKKRTYARASRRQGATPDIPRPGRIVSGNPDDARIFGVVVDTSGSMSAEMIGKALGSIASYSASKEVPYARVVFCDAAAYDAGYLSTDEIAGRVEVKGRGGTVLQPAVNLLENAEDFPKNGPILIITDGYIEKDLVVKRKHAFLLPQGNRLPFRAKDVFYFK